MAASTYALTSDSSACIDLVVRVKVARVRFMHLDDSFLFPLERHP